MLSASNEKAVALPVLDFEGVKCDVMIRANRPILCVTTVRSIENKVGKGEVIGVGVIGTLYWKRTADERDSFAGIPANGDPCAGCSTDIRDIHDLIVSTATHIERIAWVQACHAGGNRPFGRRDRLRGRTVKRIVSCGRHIVCRGLNRDGSDKEEKSTEWQHNKRFDLF